MSKPRINEVVVVEGKNDTHAIRRAVDADTIETNGSAISERVLYEIERASQNRGVIVFTDPDSAGERIRRIISERIPFVKHAFLSRLQATNGEKIGIEYASPKAIIEALNHVRVQDKFQNTSLTKPIEWVEYIDQGFTGQPYSSQLREKVAAHLRIGYGNAKQFYQRLVMLQISPEELSQAIEAARRDERV